MNTQNSSNFQTLYCYGHDLIKFCILWAAIVGGGVSVLLDIRQVLLSAAEVAIAVSIHSGLSPSSGGGRLYG